MATTQSTIYGGYADVTPSHLDDLSKIYFLVDDITSVPFVTRRVQGSQLDTSQPTILKPTAPTTLAGTEKFNILVNSQDQANYVQLASGQSALIINTSDNASDLDVKTASPLSTTTLGPGQFATVVYQSGTGQTVTVGSANVVDDAMSDSSLNPVQNSVVKAYIDASPGGGGTVDDDVTELGTNPVKSSGIWNFWQSQDAPAAAMSDANELPVQNSVIKAYVDNIAANAGTLVDQRGKVTANDEVVFGTGNATTDTAAMIAAVAALEAKTAPGTLYFDNEVWLNAPVYINLKPVGLQGLTERARIHIAGANGEIKYGNYWEAKTTGSSAGDPAAVTVTSIAAFDHSVTSPSLTLEVGDLFAVWGDNTITGMLPNLTYQCPLEIHKVFRDNGSNNYSVGGFIVDPMNSNQKIRRVPVLTNLNSPNISGCRIGNFKVSQASGVHNLRLLDLRRLNDVTVHDIHIEDSATWGGTAQLSATYCYNVKFERIRIDGVQDYDGAGGTGSNYGIELAAVNGVIITGCFFSKLRHAVDTTSASANATTRWGTPRNVLVQGNVFHCEGHSGSSLGLASNHGEGYGMTYDGNVFEISDYTTNFAATIRAERRSSPTTRCSAVVSARV